MLLASEQQNYLSQVFRTHKFYDGRRVPNLSLLLAGRRAGKTTIAAVMAKRMIERWGNITQEEFEQKADYDDIPSSAKIVLTDDIFEVFRTLATATATQDDQHTNPNKFELHKFKGWDDDLQIQGKFLKFSVHRVRGISNVKDGDVHEPYLFAAFDEVSWANPMYEKIETLLTRCSTFCRAASCLDMSSPTIVLNSTPKKWDPKDWFTSWVTERNDMTSVIGPHHLMTHHYTSWELNPIFPKDATFSGTDWYTFTRDYAAFKLTRYMA